MEKLYKRFSFICLAVAFLLCLCWVESNYYFHRTVDKITSSITVSVYVDESASGNDIQKFKTLFTEFEEFEIREFISSVSAYKKLSEEEELLKQVGIIGDDITLPASFILTVKQLNAGRIKKLAGKIKKMDKVQHVEVPLDLLEKSESMIQMGRLIKNIAAFAVSAISLFLLFCSAYLNFMKDKDKLKMALNCNVPLLRAVSGSVRYAFFTGCIAAAAAAAVLYVLNNLLNAEFPFLRAAVPAVFAGGPVYSFCYLFTAGKLYKPKFLCLLIVFVFSLYFQVNAGYREDIANVQEKIENQKEELDKLETEINNYQSRIKKLNIREKNISRQINIIKTEIEHKKESLKELEGKIKQKEEDISELENNLSIQRNKSRNYSKFVEKTLKYYYFKVFPQKNLSWYASFAQNTGFPGYIIKKIVNEPALKYYGIKKEIERAAEIKKKMELEKKALVKLKEEVIKIQNSFIQQSQKQLALLRDVEVQRQRQQNKLKQLEEEKEKLDSLIVSLRKRAKNLEKLSILAEDFVSAKGEIPWPVEGFVISSFGKHKDPALGAVIYNRGIKIRTVSQEDVKAVAGGEVVYAGKFTGLGNMVVIDHGKDYYTIYGELEEVLADVGSVIEPLSSVGRLSGGVLYFELGKSSSPLDPLDWLEGK